MRFHDPGAHSESGAGDATDSYGVAGPGGVARRRQLLGALVLLGGIAVLAMIIALPAPRNRDADLGDFNRVSGTVVQSDGTSRRLCLLYAETSAQHQRGLMGVTDPTLDGCDGMLFTFSRDTTMPFWMRNTPLPLSIAYFDSRGRVVSIADMSPCGDHADCPSYPPASPYRYAIEVPQGRLPELGIAPGARLDLESIRSVGATAATAGRVTVEAVLQDRTRVSVWRTPASFEDIPIASRRPATDRLHGLLGHE